MTFEEKLELADAMEMDGYMYSITKVEGDTVHYADCYGNYTTDKAELQRNDAELFIKITDKEAV